MTRSSTFGNLVVALETFQKRIKPLKKAATAEKNGDVFTYAPIDDVLKHVRLPLARLGLFVLQTVTGDIGVTTHIYHVPSGEWVEDTAIVSAKSMEDKGAAITQLRRYSLITLLGLPTVDAPQPSRAVDTLLEQYTDAERIVIIRHGLDKFIRDKLEQAVAERKAEKPNWRERVGL